MNFQERQKEPILKKIEILSVTPLKTNQMVFAATSLRENLYSTFDGLLNLEWPSLTGRFFDLGKYKEIVYPPQAYDPEMLYVNMINLHNYKIEHTR